MVIYSSERQPGPRCIRRSGSLGAKPPFDLQKSLRFIDGIPQISGEQDTSRGMLTKAVMVDGQTVVFRVGPERDGKAGVYYEMFSKTLITEAVAEKVADRISFFLSLQDDLAPFYAIAARDPKFYPIAKKQVGLHHVKTWSLFEITCWALIAQRTQMPVAKKTRDTLIARFGGSIELEGRTYSAFPDYQTLRTVKVAEISRGDEEPQECGTHLVVAIHLRGPRRGFPADGALLEGRGETEADKGDRGLVGAVHTVQGIRPYRGNSAEHGASGEDDRGRLRSRV